MLACLPEAVVLLLSSCFVMTDEYFMSAPLVSFPSLDVIVPLLHVSYISYLCVGERILN